MKLYCSPTSSTSRAVMFFVRHLGLDLEEVHVDLMSGEQYGRAFSEVNPNHLVPVLEEEDGWRLTESSAILKYLAQREGSELYPEDLRARARVNERMDWLNTQFYREYGYHYAYPQLFEHHRRPGPANKATVVWGASKARGSLEVLERTLGASAFLAGESLSIADFLGTGLFSVGDLTRTDLSPFPQVKEWFARMKQMDGWRAVSGPHDGFAQQLRSEGVEFIQL